jgi:hypothetical protein
MTQVAPIFKDPERQKLFDKQGFIVVPLLSKEEIVHMNELFNEVHPELPESGFYAGSYSQDFEYKKRVSEEIKVVFKRAYDGIFENYETFGGAFLFKMPTPDSDLFIHQDWTVVNEDEKIALNVWVPLCDITEENGPLMVVPGSHYASYPVLRAPTMRYFFDHDYQQAMDQLVPVIVPKGTAVILNQSLIHYSPPNRSQHIRKAITSGVKTKGAQMVFHFKDPDSSDNMIEKFEMDDDFFIQFEDFFKDIYKRPTVGESVGMMEYEVPMLNGPELETILRKMKTSAGYEFKEAVVEEVVHPQDSTEPEEEAKWVDDRTFFETYTPANIFKEIKSRIKTNL